LSAFESAQRTT
jgi:hypothetical protein